MVELSIKFNHVEAYMSRRAIPLVKHHSLDELENFAASCDNTNVYRRVSSIIDIMNGASRANAAKRGHMSPDVLRYWINRYNDLGLDGLIDLKSPGRPRKLEAAQTVEFIKVVKAGPNPEINGIGRWRLCDLVVVIHTTFGIKITIASVWNLLKREGFSIQSPRPRHPKQNPDDIPAFKRDFDELVTGKTRHVSKETPIHIWFQDEARIGEKNNQAKSWAPVGERPIVPADMGYQVGYLFGAICPELGEAVGLVLASANTASTQIFLDCLSDKITDHAHGVIIMDRATWHTTTKLRIPDNITIIYLPPYCPELNSIEQIWDFLRKNYLPNRIFNTWDVLVEAICWAWNQLCKLPEKISKIGTREWATIKR